MDIVKSGHEFDAEDKSFNTIISCECFEHNPFWKETFQNMIRMCKSKGLVIMTCATTGRPEHGTTRSASFASPLTVEKGWDYYKNLTKKDFTDEFVFENLFSSYEFSVDDVAKDLYFYGIKK